MSSDLSINSPNPFSFVPVQCAFSGTPTITTEKFNGKNYLLWSASVELWFLGHGFSDHLENSVADIPEDQRGQWEKFDYQLCALLWQSVEPSILSNFRAFKTCSYFWKKVKSVYANDIQQLYDAGKKPANDIQRLYDAAQKLASLKQTDHDMDTYLSEAQAAFEELKMLLQADTLEEQSKKLDNLFMVMILRGLHQDYEHVRDQILTSTDVTTMHNLVTRLLRLPLHKTQPTPHAVETSEIAANYNRGRGGVHGGRNSERAGRNSGRGAARPRCSYCGRMGHIVDKCYSLKGFPRMRGDYI